MARELKPADTNTRGSPNNICAICHDALVDNLGCTSCGHVFHQSCYQEWELVSVSTSRPVASCPICATPVSSFVRLYVSFPSTALQLHSTSQSTQTESVVSSKSRPNSDEARAPDNGSRGQRSERMTTDFVCYGVSVNHNTEESSENVAATQLKHKLDRTRERLHLLRHELMSEQIETLRLRNQSSNIAKELFQSKSQSEILQKELDTLNGRFRDLRTKYVTETLQSTRLHREVNALKQELQGGRGQSGRKAETTSAADKSSHRQETKGKRVAPRERALPPFK